MRRRAKNRGPNSSSLLSVLPSVSNPPNDKKGFQTVSRRRFVTLTLALVAVAIFSINRIRATTTTTANTAEDHNFNDNFFDTTTWPALRSALCRDGAPNVALGSTLFRLARQEVFDSAYVPTRTPPSSLLSSLLVEGDLRRHFFSIDFGTSVFRGVNEHGKRFWTVYVRIPKCGNNQIRAIEEELFQNYEGLYFYESILVQALQPLYENEPSPCIYTAVRDPISHFLSGYNEFEYRLHYSELNRSLYEYPLHHRAFPYSKDDPGLRRKRFLAFVEDLLLEDSILAGSKWETFHVYPMSGILHSLKRFKTNLTGYINGLKDLTTTWPEFMASTCGGELGFPSRERLPKEMTFAGQHPTSNDTLGLYQAAKDVWAEQGPIARALCLLHAFDYACFPDLPEPIPALCRTVYRDHSKTILEDAAKLQLPTGPSGWLPNFLR